MMSKVQKNPLNKKETEIAADPVRKKTQFLTDEAYRKKIDKIEVQPWYIDKINTLVEYITPQGNFLATCFPNIKGENILYICLGDIN